MKTLNKKELLEIAFNHSADTYFRDFMNLYKKCTAKSFNFLVIDATLALDNHLYLKKNLLERI